MVSQLRIYTINKGKLDEFVKGWTEFVYPLHYSFGFTIDLAEVIEERSEFVWIVSYDGPDSWDDKQAEYYASPSVPRSTPIPRNTSQKQRDGS